MLLHDEAHSVWKWFAGYKIETTIIAGPVIIALACFAWVWDPPTVPATVAMLVALSPIWLPFFLGTMLLVTWVHYVRYHFWFNREMTLLEIQLPAEVTKSPEGIEIFLSSIYNTGSETTFLNRLWKGGFRPVWSLEMASNEGKISFYIHCMKVWMHAVEGRIYGQYPEAKVMEVDDYVTKVPFNLDDYELWGSEYRKMNAVGAIPFKTYVDFSLDKDTDTPETKTDPMVNIWEVMNLMGKDEYLWMQIIIRGHAKQDWYGFPDKDDAFVEDGKKKIKEFMAGAAKRAQEVLKESDIVDGKMNALLTEGERDTVKAIEHSFSKNIFDSGMRIVYIAKKEKFKGITGAFLYRGFQVFRNKDSGIIGTRGMIRFDYPWEDFMGIRERQIKKLLHFHYKYRAYFNVPYDQVPMYLSTEEIATLWHFPWSSTKTPGLNRVPAKTETAPSNLPILPQ
jgi:hypothetical protein